MLTQVITVKSVDSDWLQEKINEELKKLNSPIVYEVVNILITSNSREYLALIVYKA